MGVKTGRSKFLSVVLFVFLGLLLSGCENSSKVSSSILNGNKPLTDKWGIYINVSDSKGFIKEQVNVAKKIGFKFVRVPVDQLPFGADYAQKIKLVEYALRLVQENKMIPVVNFTGGTPGNLDGKAYTHLINTICNDIQKIVRNNANSGIVWEGWNEPNGAFWTNDTNHNVADANIVNEWIVLDNRIHKIIRQYDPNAVFLNGDLEGMPKNNSQYISAIKSSNSYRNSKVISFHPYLSKQFNEGRPENLIKDFPRYSSRTPYVITEFGYSIPQNSEVYEQRLGVWSYEQQKAYLSRAVFIMDMKKLPMFILFNTSNKKTNYGIETDGTMNIAGQMLKKINRTLLGYTFNKKIQTSNDVYALLYTKRFSPDKVVYWSQNDKNIDFQLGSQKLTATMTPKVTMKNKYYYIYWVIGGICIVLCSIYLIRFTFNRRIVNRSR